MKLCCVPQCKNEDKAKGYCRTHYRDLKRYGEIRVYECKETIRAPKPLGRRQRQCIMEGCQNAVLALDLCTKHYTRNRKYGSPNVNFKRKATSEFAPLMREETRYRLTADERLSLGCLFKEAVGLNEGENCYSID